MIRNGIGGANTNATGLKFEKDVDLATALTAKGYDIVPLDESTTGKEKVKAVYDEKGLRGYLVAKNALRAFLLNEYGVDIREELSKQLLPDEGFFNTSQLVLHILEKKFQCTSGSVDEKIQTGAFKLHEYEHLMRACSDAAGEEIGVTYDYVLSDWFKSPAYHDVLNYNEDHGIGHYFSEVPLDALGL